jgi:putative addiction module component (TIGR02574 family)
MGKLLEEIQKLSAEEQIRLIAEVWNQIPESVVLDTSPEVAHLLHERLASHRSNPSAASSLEDVVNRIQGRW